MMKKIIIILLLLSIGVLVFILTRQYTTTELIMASKDDLIKVTFPRISEVVASPLTVHGEARGNWFFEASFPVKLLDEDGNVLAQMPAHVENDSATGMPLNWMTQDYVPFAVTLSFGTPKGNTGTLILIKDNPSGDPARDNALQVPVRFK